MSAFEAHIDYYLKLQKHLGLRNNRTQDYSIISRYLRLYKLKNKKPKITFEQLAEKMYPTAAKKNIDSAIQQVKREYYKAKRLINGGYKKIK